MLKQFNLSLYFLLCVLFLLSACSNAGESPAIVVVEVSATPVNTVQPTAMLPPTSTPTPENPVFNIVPPPLPTPVPDQQARLEQAREDEAQSVDFVIDMSQLEERSIPVRFVSGESWYKYTSPDGAFSVLIQSGAPPQESVEQRGVDDLVLEARIVKGNAFFSQQAVIYFVHPLLADGEHSI